MKIRNGLKANYAKARCCTSDKNVCLHSLRHLGPQIVSKFLIGESKLSFQLSFRFWLEFLPKLQAIFMLRSFCSLLPPFRIEARRAPPFTFGLEISSCLLFKPAFDSKSKKSYIIPPRESPLQFFSEHTFQLRQDRNQHNDFVKDGF